MKVCFIRHAYFPQDPRDRKQVYALIAAGHSVDVICLRKKDQIRVENVKDVRVYRCPLSHKRKGLVRYLAEYSMSFLFIQSTLFLLFIKNRYDCIQVCTMPDFLIFTTILPKICGAKIVLDLHEPSPELWVTKYCVKGFSPPHFLMLLIEQLAMSYADGSLTVTETLKNRYVSRGADSDKISVVRNVCEDSFHTDSDRPKDKAKFLIATHGIIEERYGHKLLLEAVALLGDKVPGLQLDIMGEGEEKYVNYLASFSRELGVDCRIRFHGYLRFGDLLRLLEQADVCIIAMHRSPYSELIDTNKMYEYVALKKAVIAPRLPGMQEVFDESAMMFFEPGDPIDLARCILELYLDPDKRSRLSEKAHDCYHKIQWSITQKSYVEVLEKLVGKAP